jgi:hypothetical protein
MVTIVSDSKNIKAFLSNNSYLQWIKFSNAISSHSNSGHCVEIFKIKPVGNKPSMLDFTIFVQKYLESRD